jgi:prepilin peptidase CpaA
LPIVVTASQSWLIHVVLPALGAALLVAAALHDVAVRSVPNKLPAALAVIGGMLRLLCGDLPTALLAACLLFLLAAACWRRGWLGGGDVKLLGAAALLVSPPAVLTLVLATALSGGVLALAYLALGRALRRPPGKRPATMLARLLRVERWRIRRGGPLPYATAIAAAALFCVLRG